MTSLISRLARLLPSNSVAQQAAEVDGVAHNLMERAEAGAGRNPYQSQELRSAAQAYLSVIR